MIFITILITALLTIVNGSEPNLVCYNCCRLCGKDKKVGLPDKLFFDPNNIPASFSQHTCAEMEWKAYKEEVSGFAICENFQYRARLRCGCTPGDIPTPTSKPTPMPTRKPTLMPTRKPTHKPTRLPTRMPTDKPTRLPTRMPTNKPTPKPTKGKKPKL